MNIFSFSRILYEKVNFVLEKVNFDLEGPTKAHFKDNSYTVSYIRHMTSKSGRRVPKMLKFRKYANLPKRYHLMQIMANTVEVINFRGMVYLFS